MDKRELSQLYYLNREIEEQQRRLEELKCLATSCTSKITGIPQSKNMNDRLAGYAAEIAELKEQIDLNLKKCFYELNRLNRFINDIDDSQMRLILELRYINGLKWDQVAESISCCLSGESVRKAHDRFLAKHKKLSFLSG